MRILNCRLNRIARNLAALTAQFVVVSSIIKVDVACAQFTTVINSPPTIIGNLQSVDSNTQLNVNTGGSVGDNFDAGKSNRGTSSNIEVNIAGGSVGHSFEAFGGTKVNITGGTVGFNFRAQHGSSVNISGGRVRTQFVAMDGSSVNINGGEIGDDFAAQAGSRVTVSGGSIGDDFHTAGGSMVDVTGGTFTRDLLAEGIVNFGGGSVLGQILVNGGNLTVSGGSIVGLEVDANSTTEISGGRFSFLRARSGSRSVLAGGTIGRQLITNSGSDITLLGGEFRLEGVPIPGLETPGSSLQINLPSGSLLSGTLADGTPFAFTSDDEDSIANGTLTLMAANLPTIGPPVISFPNLTTTLGIREEQVLVVSSGGAVSDGFHAGRGSVTVMIDGTVGADFEAVGATIIITGGKIGDGFDAFDGSTLSMHGGQLGNFADAENSSIDLFGGQIGASFTARNGTVVNVSGGEIEYGLQAQNGSQVNISGGTIKDNFTASSSIVNISGGSVGNFFWAHSDSSVRISGGTIGQGVRAGSRFDVYGGEFRLDGQLIYGLDGEGKALAFNLPPLSVLSGILADGTPFAFTGSQVLGFDEIHDGSLVLHAQALPPTGPTSISVPIVPAPRGARAGQTLTVADGGVVADNFNASWGSTVNIAGGEVGEHFEAIGADVTISGGKVGRAFTALYGSTVHISGGNVGQYFSASRGAVVNISGGTVDRDAVAGRGSIINVSGGHVDSSFTAQEGSIVNVSGGFIDRFFRARNESAVNITAGTLEDLDAFSESVVNISGGTIGYFSTSGTATISGGRFRGISANPGSVVLVSAVDADSLVVRTEDGVNVTGGEFHYGIQVAHGGVANVSGGTFEGSLLLENGTVNLYGGIKNAIAVVHHAFTVNVFGTNFSLDDVDITESLTQNVPHTITTRDVPFSAILADGSPFQLDLRHSLRIGDETFDPNAKLTVTLVLPGDCNVDGVVDAADYVLWRGTLGSSVSALGSGADGNFDGQVTHADYDVWRRNFGETLGGRGGNDSLNTLAVPAPTSSIVICLGSILLVAFGGRETRRIHCYSQNGGAATRIHTVVIQPPPRNGAVSRETAFSTVLPHVDKARSRELGGTGLGLAIVKHLAQSFGGKVGVTSEPGQGSTFIVELPVA